MVNIIHMKQKKKLKVFINSHLYKSHSEHGFEEPVVYYENAIGPSEIIFKKFLQNKNYINLLFGTMGNDSKNKGQMSLHFLSLNKKMQITDNDIIGINERVRDLIYDENTNQIILFLETSSSIGVLRKLL